jgi:AraC family transcriptional regulator
LATSGRSQAEYDRRMHAVVEYIDRNLDQPLDLASVAAVAHFSDFHFHRLFRALMGEALGDYVRRRRLELAAVRLRAQPAVPVLEIALQVGFGSAEAFARAFRNRFAETPTLWRNSKAGQMERKPDQAAESPRGKHGDSRAMEIAMKPLNVKLIDRPPVHVAYLRHTGPYGPSLGQFWMQRVAPWMATNNLYGRERFGISLDDPTVTKPAQCRYDACVTSPEGELLSGGPQHKIIPGGKYASLAYEGTGMDIGDAWDALLRDWLPTSGLQLDARPFFEVYPVNARYDPKTAAFSCDICVPVAAL